MPWTSCFVQKDCARWSKGSSFDCYLLPGFGWGVVSMRLCSYAAAADWLVQPWIHACQRHLCFFELGTATSLPAHAACLKEVVPTHWPSQHCAALHSLLLLTQFVQEDRWREGQRAEERTIQHYAVQHHNKGATIRGGCHLDRSHGNPARDISDRLCTGPLTTTEGCCPLVWPAYRMLPYMQAPYCLFSVCFSQQCSCLRILESI